jgi:hypothetical protein
MNDMLISRNIISGISKPFEVSDQVTVYAYNLEPGQRVSFEIVALSELIKSACGNCPPAVTLPSVVDSMPLKCCGDLIAITRDQPWVVIDSPQGAKIRARLETSGGVIVVPNDQLVVYNKTNTINVNDRMRGCACAGA